MNCQSCGKGMVAGGAFATVYWHCKACGWEEGMLTATVSYKWETPGMEASWAVELQRAIDAAQYGFVTTDELRGFLSFVSPKQVRVIAGATWKPAGTSTPESGTEQG